MIIILIIAVAMFLISYWKLRYGLAVIILLWPAYLLRTTIFGIPTTALELSIYAVTAAAVFLYVVGRIPRPGAQMSRTAWLVLTVWVLAWIIATFFSSDRTASLGALKAWLIDPLLFSALLLLTIRTGTDRLFVFKAAVVSGAIVSWAGLYQLVWAQSTLQEGRLSSFFHPVANYAAMYIVPLFILGLGLLLGRQIHGYRWWTVVSVMFIAAVFTFSYGGFLALAAASFVLWIFLAPSRFKKWSAIMAVILGVTAIALLSTTKNFSEHFRTIDRSSGLVRKQIWVTSWALIRQHPILGVGPNAFEPAYRAEIPKHYFPPLEWLVAQPHNLYLSLWLETGIIGLVIFSIGLFGWFWKVKNYLVPIDRLVAVSCLAAMTAILVHGLVDTPYFKNDLALEFMFVLVLPWLGTRENKTP